VVAATTESAIFLIFFGVGAQYSFQLNFILHANKDLKNIVLLRQLLQQY
jgi:hypothetical protein